MKKKIAIPKLKIAVVGSSKVGKYSLSHQYANGWIAPRDTNAENVQNPIKNVQLENGKYEIEIFACRDLESEELNSCDGMMLVFSIVDKSSFLFIKTTAFQKLHERYGFSSTSGENAGKDSAKKAADGDLQDIAETPTRLPEKASLRVPAVLVGNKVDEANLSRQVETNSAEELSQNLSCVGFFETGATCNADVPKAFQCLLTEIINRSTPQTQKVKKKSKTGCTLL